MGLLDDAIREHLDLQRKRGADPTEIERAEREALGPVRRSPEEPRALEDDPGAPAAFDHELEAEPFDHEDADEHAPAYEPVPEPDDDPFANEPGRPRHELIAEEHEPFLDKEEPPDSPTTSEHPSSGIRLREPGDELDEEDDPFDEEPSDRATRPADHAGEETVEYEVEAEFAENDEKQGTRDEDVLEETPEFLQDAPEHDRLWFEQRPPKDFDFDG